MSITRVPDITTNLGKSRNGISNAIGAFAKAAEAWNALHWPDSELEATRTALEAVYTALLSLEKRLIERARRFYDDHPGPGDLPPIEDNDDENPPPAPSAEDRPQPPRPRGGGASR